jgi:hypothetical protein
VPPHRLKHPAQIIAVSRARIWDALVEGGEAATGREVASRCTAALFTATTACSPAGGVHGVRAHPPELGDVFRLQHQLLIQEVKVSQARRAASGVVVGNVFGDS